MVQAVVTSTGAGLAIFVFVVMGICIYFIPTFVAVTRKVTNSGSVFVINLLLGWSIVGWAIALAMAVKTNMTRVEIVNSEARVNDSSRPAAQSQGAASHPPVIPEAGRRCPRCDKALPGDAHKCTRCDLVVVDVFSDGPQRSARSNDISKWCDSCEIELAPDDRFCRKCGSAAQEVNVYECIECGGEIELEDKFCRSCGVSLD